MHAREASESEMRGRQHARTRETTHKHERDNSHSREATHTQARAIVGERARGGNLRASLTALRAIL